MRRVFVCSPYRGDIDRNLSYARSACMDAVRRGEAPLAPHLYLPTVLDDSLASDRRKGMECGFAWLASCDAVAVYSDYGISEGMAAEIAIAEIRGIPVEDRSLGAPWKET